MTTDRDQPSLSPPSDYNKTLLIKGEEGTEESPPAFWATTQREVLISGSRRSKRRKEAGIKEVPVGEQRRE